MKNAKSIAIIFLVVAVSVAATVIVLASFASAFDQTSTSTYGSYTPGTAHYPYYPAYPTQPSYPSTPGYGYPYGSGEREGGYWGGGE